MAAVTLLSTDGLCRHFGGLRAVDGVDFSLNRGEVRAIIGPNGAGKTTFVSLICGRILPSSGSITFEGRNISALPAHRRVELGIAYTFQITSIFGNLSVFDNVALAVQNSMHRAGGSFFWLDEAQMRRRIFEALDHVGLDDRHDVKASALSYGHQRLLEVAMGLALSPKLLILDEPTQGLSDAEIAGFCKLVRSIAEDATVLLIEHNMDVVMEVAGRITVMNNGTILSEGTPAEIRDDEAVQHAYLGT
ncbi:ABC transporter ATP-binding protein [Microbaculum marinum]|uniref:ABC transporter ATP-binding protein n=1 Tax=Microbaculum marinum TaxID=1764581 RepID=A0AAW9S195_9HYPH